MVVKKQIYIIEHAHIKTWKYVGATKGSLDRNLASKWCHRKKKNFILSRVMKDSWRAHWSIRQLHDFTEDWERLEAEYIARYDTYHNGLNSTPSGQHEVTEIQRTNMANVQKTQCQTKPIRCIDNGIVYSSATEAMRQTNINQSDISKCCRGQRRSAGGFKWEFVTDEKPSTDGSSAITYLDQNPTPPIGMACLLLGGALDRIINLVRNELVEEYTYALNILATYEQSVKQSDNFSLVARRWVNNVGDPCHQQLNHLFEYIKPLIDLVGEES
jgi:hypothetical protein